MSNAIMVGWNRAVPGRERQAIESFSEFTGWLTKQQQAKNVTSFQPVILASHGGDLNGFVLISGDPEKLGKLTMNEEWLEFMTKGAINLRGWGSLRASTGDEVATVMKRASKYI